MPKVRRHRHGSTSYLTFETRTHWAFARSSTSCKALTGERLLASQRKMSGGCWPASVNLKPCWSTQAKWPFSMCSRQFCSFRKDLASNSFCSKWPAEKITPKRELEVGSWLVDARKTTKIDRHTALMAGREGYGKEDLRSSALNSPGCIMVSCTQRRNFASKVRPTHPELLCHLGVEEHEQRRRRPAILSYFLPEVILWCILVLCIVPYVKSCF